MRILVVDDEKLLVKLIKFNFEQEGYEIETAYNGEDAIRTVRDKHFDIVFLDIMLPKINGLTVCRRIREFSNVPIIMLTAKTDDSDKIIALNHGADDYITKPFNIMELKARVTAILRRSHTSMPGEKAIVPISTIKLDYNLRKVKIQDKWIDLTVKEFDLLDLMASNAGKVYNRENLLDIIWGYDYTGDPRTVDVHIRRIREKIEPNSAEPVYILTKWGVGYYFSEH